VSTTDWMRQIPDTKWLRQIVMPGSHDAGVYGTAQTSTRGVPGFVSNPTRQIVCQHSDFGRQALAGSRFFDCRVFLKKTRDATGAKTYEQRLGHFFKEKVPLSKQPTAGGYGGALTAIVSQALDFVIANPSEFIILRFSHTYHPAECINAIKEVIASNPAYPGVVYKQTGNIATKTIGSLRKKVIMVFDEKFNHNITPGEGIHRFKKFSADADYIDGLSTCGNFASTSDVKKVHTESMKGVEKHVKEHVGKAGHLHFIYWQQTGGDVYKTTTAPKKDGQEWTGGAHSNMGDCLYELWQQTTVNVKPANVISHDFVSAETCEKIIRLNPECH
jgi:hypothetical protein